MTYGNATYDDTNGVTYTITESGDAPTMQSNFYMFFGTVSVIMKTAPGTGIVSCSILESDDLDEVDWEWLGGTSTQAETNYFGKGNTSSYDRATYVTTADSQTDFHNYTVYWSKDELIWYVDGASVRTLAYADALDGQNYPQTPMRVKLGIWAGGDSSNSAGTIEWAGGATDYAQGPFSAYVQSVSITNFNPAASYSYGDLTGSYDSIVLSDAVVANSTAETDSSTKASGSSPTATFTSITSLSTGSGSSLSGAQNGTWTTSNPTATSATVSSSSPSSTAVSNSEGTNSSSSTTATSAASSPLLSFASSFTVLLGMAGCAFLLV